MPEIIENDEISINYVINKIIWNQNVVNIDDAFVYNITMIVMSRNDDQEQMTIEESQQRNGWPKSKDVVEAIFDLLAKQKVFGLAVHTPEAVKPIRYKWFFHVKTK